MFLAEVLRIGDTRKVIQIDYVDEEQLIVVISGKQHCVRLIPIGALDGYGVEWIKLTDTKGCTVCCVGNPSGASRTLLCVAMKRHILIYEITRDKGRHRRLREIPLDYTPQCLNVRGEKLFVGFPSTFGVFSLLDDTASCTWLFANLTKFDVSTLTVNSNFRLDHEGLLRRKGRRIVLAAFPSS